MMLQNFLREKHMSVYKLAKDSEVPYTTCSDIINGKTQLEKCSAETVYKLARALDVSMETLLDPRLIRRSSFENFKSTICHRVKELGDLDFIMDTLESQDIRRYYDRKWYPESLYLLAMLDYISRENSIPLCDEYDDLRHCKLEKVIYPVSLLAMSAAFKTDEPLKAAAKTALPEFRRFNIIESEVRNVV